MLKTLKTSKIINNETGEVLTLNQLTFIKELIDDTHGDIRKSNSYIAENLGNYFHLLYGDILSLDIEPQYMVRFLKLCCHCNYDNVLIRQNSKKHIKEKDLVNILNLSERETRNTKKYLKEKELIIFENEKITINNKYTIKGSIKGDLINMEVIRVFNDGFSELYNSVNPRQHRLLASFIKLLPYTNVKYNVISKIKDSVDFDTCEPLTSIEISEICGYEKPSKLIKDLLKLKLYDQFALIKIVRGDRDYFVVNPKIYYKGNNIESLQYIQKFFDFE